MKLICVGRNYAKHVQELQNSKPEEPIIFLKPDTAILLKGQAFFIPDFSEEIHYETEVLVKINRIGKYIQPKFAHKYYEEIGLGIDFTARDVQTKLKKEGLPWEKAKAFDGSAVITRNWIKKSCFETVDKLSFSLKKNGDIVQAANTSQMLWKIDELIAYISQYMTLKIGDIIFTGTPEGVGKVNPDDELIGYLEDKEMFKIKVK